MQELICRGFICSPTWSYIPFSMDFIRLAISSPSGVRNISLFRRSLASSCLTTQFFFSRLLIRLVRQALVFRCFLGQGLLADSLFFPQAVHNLQHFESHVDIILFEQPLDALAGRSSVFLIPVDWVRELIPHLLSCCFFPLMAQRYVFLLILV